MEIKTDQIEKLFSKADFSKETGLKMDLKRKLFPVREVSLKDLMAEEGLRNSGPEKREQKRQRTASLHGERSREKEPPVKKNSPPRM